MEETELGPGAGLLNLREGYQNPESDILCRRSPAFQAFLRDRSKPAGRTGGTQTPREPSGRGELLEAPGPGTFPSCLPGCIAAPGLVFLLSGNLFICA